MSTSVVAATVILMVALISLSKAASLIPHLDLSDPFGLVFHEPPQDVGHGMSRAPLVWGDNDDSTDDNDNGGGDDNGGNGAEHSKVASAVRERSATRSGAGETYGELEQDYDDGIYNIAHLFYDLKDIVLAEAEKTNTSLETLANSVDTEISEMRELLDGTNRDMEALKSDVTELKDRANGVREAQVGDVRLQFQDKGPLMAHGRLLVYTGEEHGWGYVCDDLFYSSKSADVVCRQLGYNYGLPDILRDYSGQTNTDDSNFTILLDNVACPSNSPNLMLCPHEPVGRHNCAISEAVDILCLNN